MVESDSKIDDVINNNSQLTQKKWVYWLWPISNIGVFFLASITGFWDYYFMTILGVQTWIYAIIFTVYAIINAINGPIIAYYTEKEYKWTRSQGRRYPWIKYFGWISPIFYAITFFIPSPAIIGQWTVAGIFLIIIVFADTFNDLGGIPQGALLPEKFRTDRDRRRQKSIEVPINFLGTFIGIGIGFVITIFGYQIAALVGMGVRILTFFISLPTKTDPSHYQHIMETQAKLPSLWHVFKDIIKMRNFWPFIVFSMTTVLYMGFLAQTLPFYLRFVQGMEHPELMTMIMQATFVLLAMLSNPLWVLIGKKLGYKKTIILANFILFFGAALVFFLSNLIIIFIAIVIMGLGYGHGAVIQIQSLEFQDEYTFLTRRRNGGLISSIEGIVNRIVVELQNWILALIFFLTNFNPSEELAVVTPEAILGIKLQISFIPSAFILIGLIVYWIVWDMTAEKRSKILTQLHEWNL